MAKEKKWKSKTESGVNDIVASAKASAKPDESPTYRPMAHSHGTDAFSRAGGMRLESDASGGFGITQVDESATLYLMRTDKNKSIKVIPDGPIKLMWHICMAFTDANHTGKGKAKEVNSYRVAIPLVEYAHYRKMPIYEEAKENEADAKIERNRVLSTFRNARRQAHKEADFLYNLSIDSVEKIKGRNKICARTRIVSGYEITNDLIVLDVAPAFGEILIQMPLTQIPIFILSISGNRTNALALGIKLNNHYFNDNNIKRGTYNRLKVKTLLEWVNLNPNEKTVSKNGWWNRFKDPLEKMLDALVEARVISNYEYCKTGGVPLTDEEGKNWESLEQWSNTLIKFEFPNPPDQTKRLEARTKEAEAAKKKKEKEAKKKAQEKQEETYSQTKDYKPQKIDESFEDELSELFNS